MKKDRSEITGRKNAEVTLPKNSTLDSNKVEKLIVKFIKKQFSRNEKATIENNLNEKLISGAQLAVLHRLLNIVREESYREIK